MDGHAYLRTHDLSAGHMLLDLNKALSELRGGSSGAQARGAITLLKQSSMSVVLTHLLAGSGMKEHAAPGPVTVQVLDGRVRLQIGEESVEATAGRLIAFNAGVRHSVEALEDSTLLLTIGGAG